MKRPRAAVLPLAILALLLLPAAASAAPTPPTVTLPNGFGDIYLRARPLLTLGFVVAGLLVAVSRTWSVLTGMRSSTVARDGTVTSGGSRATDLVVSLVAILVLVAVGIFLIWNWVELVNTMLEIVWSFTQDAPPSASA